MQNQTFEKCWFGMDSILNIKNCVQIHSYRQKVLMSINLYEAFVQVYHCYIAYIQIFAYVQKLQNSCTCAKFINWDKIVALLYCIHRNFCICAKTTK